MYRKIASLLLLYTTVDSIWSKSVSCWILRDCTVPFPLANTQTAATVNMEEYEKKYSHTKIIIMKKNCDIDNKKLYRTIMIIILTSIQTKIYTGLERGYIYNANIYTYVSYVLYIIMLARQLGKRYTQPSHKDILAYSIDCKTYMGIFHGSNKTLYVNFFNTFKLKMATNFAVSILYSSSTSLGLRHDKDGYTKMTPSPRFFLYG